MYQDFTTKMSRNIKDLPPICPNTEPLWSEFFHMPNEKCHSLKREHGTIERSGFSSGHNDALTIEEGDASATHDRFGEAHYVGNKRTAEIRKTEETPPNGTVSLSNP